VADHLSDVLPDVELVADALLCIAAKRLSDKGVFEKDAQLGCEVSCVPGFCKKTCLAW